MIRRNHDLLALRPLFALTLVVGLAACTDDGDATDVDDETGQTDLDTDTDTDTGTEDTGTESTEDTDTTESTDTESTEDTDTTDTTGTDTESETGGDPLAIVGEYTDNWGDTHVITEETWSNGAGAFHIDAWDNEAAWLVAQNDVDNAWSPELWSVFEWTWDDMDGLWYCQSVFDADTAEDALMLAAADPMDLEMGCGGFPWTSLE